MIIDVDGHKEEAYSLIMRREYAEEIVSGKKTVEFRAFTPKYFDMFVDKDILHANDELVKQGRESETKPITRTDVGYIHFYNYNKTFTLDVEIDEVTIMHLTETDVKLLNEWWDCHDFDNEWQKYVGVKDNEIPMMFAFHISKVVNSEGL